MDGFGVIRLKIKLFLCRIMYFSLGNRLKIKPKVRIFFLQVAFLCLPCLQSGSERSDVGLKVAGTKWSSTFPDTSSLGSVFCGQEWRKKLQHVSQGLS